jgi:hypothetical protein
MNNSSSTIDNGPDVLLVLRADGMLLPVYEPALQHAEGWPWKIKRDYANALLVRGTGAILEVKNVVIRKPYGETLLSKVFSVLNSNWEVTLHTAEAETPPMKVVQAILHGLSLDSATRRNLFEKAEGEPGQVASHLKNLSIEEIFRRLHLDDPEFIALDSL